MAERTPITKTIAGWTGRAGRIGWLAGAMPLVSVRRPELTQRGNLSVIALVLRLAGVGLLAWIGYVHWLLWHLGYRDIRIDGPFFLVDAIVAGVLAAVLLAWPRPLIGLLSAGFVASTIGALLTSLSVGLFGFHESISASFVVQSLVLEIIAVVVLAAWTVIAAGIVPRRR